MLYASAIGWLVCVCVQVSKASYDDGSSSDGGHDAYLERMKAEGEERDSEDGGLLIE